MPATMYLKEQFHTGYAVRDVDLAIDSMRNRLGIARWKIIRLPEDSPGNALAFAYTGNMMVELIDVKPGLIPFYDGWIPDDPAALRVHHHGHFAKDRAEFDALTTQFISQGFEMATDDEIEGILHFRYFDTVALLGHYTEFVLMQPGGEVFWQDVPRN